MTLGGAVVNSGAKGSGYCLPLEGGARVLSVSHDSGMMAIDDNS